MKRRSLSDDKIEEFVSHLRKVLQNHYSNHWFPQQPNKGNGYRCLRIVKNKLDPLLSKAGRCCGLSDKTLLEIFPAEFTLWIDPDEVSYRIGDEGSIGVVFSSESRLGSECEDNLSESDSSECASSPSPIPITAVRPSAFVGAPVFNSSVIQRYGLYYAVPTTEWPLTIALV